MKSYSLQTGIQVHHMRIPDWGFLQAVVAFCVFAASLVCPASPQHPWFGEGAKAYQRWLDGTLDGLEQRLPEIVRSAEEAAQLYVEQGYAIKTEGDPGVRGEAMGRSGGIMEMNYARLSPITLYFPVNETDLATAPRWSAARPVVTFAPRWMVDKTRPEDGPDARIIITHTGAGGGLFTRPDGRSMVAVDRVAGVVALWVWTGEFVAACTRLGKMPAMYQGFAVPGGKERAERLTKTDPKFHHEPPEPAAAGEFGKAYLDKLRQDLGVVYSKERETVRVLAERTLETMEAGLGTYLFPPTHVLFASPSGEPFDPGYFPRINDGWSKLRQGVTLQPGDLVFCNSFDDVWPIADLAARMRADGAILAWSFSGYKKGPDEGVQAISEKELFVDQHWGFGDAVVKVPGYDIKILPTSGVITESVLRLVEAEIVRLSGGRIASEIQTQACVLDLAPTIKSESVEYAPGRFLDIYRPVTAAVANVKRPAVLLIHGGSWSGGHRDLLAPHARWFAGKGLVALNIGYRLTSADGVRVSDCVSDIMAAVAWLRAHASDYGVDPQRIIVAGESAGGHLAACTGLMTEPAARANALILFNPVIDTASPDGWRMDASYTEAERLALSPAHHVAPGAPPTLVVHGEADIVTPIRVSERFVNAMREAGNQIAFVRLPDTGHAFLLPGYGTTGMINHALAETERWLTGLGFLPLD